MHTMDCKKNRICTKSCGACRARQPKTRYNNYKVLTMYASAFYVFFFNFRTWECRWHKGRPKDTLKINTHFGRDSPWTFSSNQIKLLLFIDFEIFCWEKRLIRIEIGAGWWLWKPIFRHRDLFMYDIHEPMPENFFLELLTTMPIIIAEWCRSKENGTIMRWVRRRFTNLNTFSLLWHSIR